MGTLSVSAATVTVDDRGRVLLLCRADNGRWEIPGGVVKHGEQPPGAAARETLEETGVEVVVTGLTGVYNHVVRGVVAFVFRARPVDVREEFAGPETRAIAWCEPEEAFSRLHGTFGTRVADALEPGGVVFRAHDGGQFL